MIWFRGNVIRSNHVMKYTSIFYFISSQAVTRNTENYVTCSEFLSKKHSASSIMAQKIMLTYI